MLSKAGSSGSLNNKENIVQGTEYLFVYLYMLIRRFICVQVSVYAGGCVCMSMFV